jgi:hypothetical protein
MRLRDHASMMNHSTAALCGEGCSWAPARLSVRNSLGYDVVMSAELRRVSTARADALHFTSCFLAFLLLSAVSAALPLPIVFNLTTLRCWGREGGCEGQPGASNTYHLCGCC